MGILRVDKLSGLETPTAVTGSVSFDGSGDYLQITPDEDFAFGNSDFTIETWAYFDTVSASSGQIYEGRPSGTQGAYVSLYFSADNTFSFYTDSAVKISGTVIASRWYHIALVRNSGTTTLYLDGISQGTYSDSQSYVVRTDGPIIGVSRSGSGNPLDGYLSNYRILKGTALYTSDFTVPTQELEVIGDTIVLCCNNPDSAGAEGTGKTITVNGDAAASTFSPGLTRDFTGGTEFRGVTTFDTQGYFVPPSGTTVQRDVSGGRGIIAGSDNGIHYITISTFGNSQDFGDLTYSAPYSAGCASHTRGLVAGGFNSPTGNNTINAITISTTGNAINFGDIPQTTIYGMGGCSSSTRGLFAGGFKAPSPNADAGLLQINYVTISSLGDAQDFGDLTNGRRYPAGLASPTRGIFGGGRDSATSPVFNLNILDYITISTLGTAVNFGDLTDKLYSMIGCSNAIRGIYAGGYNPAGSATNLMNSLTIASTGNAIDFGNLSVTRGGASASSNSTRATFAGGSNPNAQNVIDYVEISSLGDALDFGDLYSTRFAAAGFSNSHGGLS